MRERKPILGSRLARGDPINSGLIDWWLFNEGGGTRIHGLVQSGSPGVATNVTPSTTSGWVRGKFGPCFAFDASDDIVTVPYRPQLVPTQAVTIAAWVYPITDGENGFGRIFNRGNLVLYIGDSSVVDAFNFSPDGLANVANSSAGSVQYGVWTFVAVTYVSGATVARFYLNGLLHTAASIAATSFTTDTDDLGIGNRPSDLARTWDGKLDNVRLFGRALDGSEILRLYTDPFAGVWRDEAPIFAPSAVANVFNPLSGRGGAAAQPVIQ